MSGLGLKVQVFENKRLGLNDTPRSYKFTKVASYQAEFCQWGCDFDDDGGEDGYGNFSVAIVKLADGTVEMPRADMIQFIG
jgi:hypothetical protein